jgi:hypothetical protein
VEELKKDQLEARLGKIKTFVAFLMTLLLRFSLLPLLLPPSFFTTEINRCYGGR